MDNTLAQTVTHTRIEYIEPSTFWYTLCDLLQEDTTRDGFIASRVAYEPQNMYDKRLLEMALDDISAIIDQWEVA